MSVHRFGVVVAAVIASFGNGCAGCGGGDQIAPGGKVCGTGSVDGTDYKIDSSELVLTIARADAFGCGALHSHVVLAKQATFAWQLGADGAGDVEIIVAAVGLDPDDAALREKYLPEGENQALSDDDRNSIRGSVLEEVKAEEHPALTFTLKDLSTINGEGTARLVSVIAGEESTVDVRYTASKDGDVVNLRGSAVIDGAPHGIPRNALGFCVDPDMGLEFTIAMSPGVVACDGEVGEVPTFVPTPFPDADCGEVGFNVVYNTVIGPRCAGCHGATLPGNDQLLRGGATVPLYTWDHFRIDSVRNPGAPLYLKGHDYVNLDTTNPDVLAMPPSATGESTGLQPLLPPITIAGSTYTTELELFNAWITRGQGRDAQCEGDVVKKTFGLNDGLRVEPGAGCDGLAYDTPQAENDNQSAADFFVGCLSCHTKNDPSRAFSAPTVATMTDVENFVAVIDFADGELPVGHPFYVDSAGVPLSFWEASIYRTEDGSMSAGAGVFEQDGRLAHGSEGPGFQAFKAWVAAGYCPSTAE